MVVTNMSFTDKTLICKDCNCEFLFTAGEQEFFHAKSLINVPKRCHNCRILMRVQRSGSSPENTACVNCAECGSATQVPFQPKGHRPVYCAACFRSKKEEIKSASTNNRVKSPEIIEL